MQGVSTHGFVSERLGWALGAVALALALCTLAVFGQRAEAAVVTANADQTGAAIGTITDGSFDFTPGSDPDPLQSGTDTGPLAGFPTAGPSYGILSTGDARFADDPNDSSGTSESFGNSDPARGNANDPVTLQIDFNVPSGNSCVLVDYRFLSEEFPEFVDKGFNDGFVAELDSTNWNAASQKINAPNDFAAGYGDQVSVDTVGPTVVTPANAAGTTYDAATTTLTAKTPVTPGAHSIYLSVFDLGDTIYDSAVFVDNLRFNNEPPTTCKPPDVFEGAVGAAVNAIAKAKGKNVLLSILCELPPGATDPCIGNASITASIPKGGASAAKRGTVAKGSYSIPPATRGTAKLKLTKLGKRLLKKKGKIKGKARITNTVNGASRTFKVKVTGKKKKRKKRKK